MQTCRLSDFIQTLTPWLDRDYIQKAVVDARGHFHLQFADGGEQIFAIDDCNAEQFEEIVALLKRNGIPVLKHSSTVSPGSPGSDQAK